MPLVDAEVIIDGCIPRDQYERSQRLLDYATDLSAKMQTHNTDERFEKFQAEINEYAGKRRFEGWIDLEDEIIDLIEDMLPDDMCVNMPEPGDVIVMKMEEAY